MSIISDENLGPFLSHRMSIISDKNLGPFLGPFEVAKFSIDPLNEHPSM